MEDISLDFENWEYRILSSGKIGPPRFEFSFLVGSLARGVQDIARHHLPFRQAHRFQFRLNFHRSCHSFVDRLLVHQKCQWQAFGRTQVRKFKKFGQILFHFLKSVM